MEVYVLTHCAASKNYTPQIFMNLESAKAQMKLLYEDCISNKSYVFCGNLYDMSCEVDYVDDTYDVFEIFEYDISLTVHIEKAHIDFKYKGVTIAQSKTFNSIFEAQNIINSMSVTYNGDEARKDFEIVIVNEES